MPADAADVQLPPARLSEPTAVVCYFAPVVPASVRKKPRATVTKGGFSAVDSSANGSGSDTSHVDPMKGIDASTAHCTVELSAAPNAGRSAELRPILALGPNVATTMRNINRKHFALVRYNSYRRRLATAGADPAPAADHPEDPAAAVVPAVAKPKLQDLPETPEVDPEGIPIVPDAAFSDSQGSFSPLMGEEIHDRFVSLEVLGSGSFGVVIRCFDQLRGEPVAVKVLRADPRFTMQGRTEARILTDIAAAARPELFLPSGTVAAPVATAPSGTAAAPTTAAHVQSAADEAARRLAADSGRAIGADHVLKLRKAFEWRGHVCIVTELLGKSLYDLLRASQFQGVSLRLTAKFGVQLSRALKLLASLRKPVVHVDVKPENILLVDDRRSAIKLVDFGSSCYESVPVKAQYAQSRFCRAPEVMLRLPYGCPVDTWSAATVLFEMHAGSPLFDGRSECVQVTRFQQLLGPLPVSMVKSSRKKRLFCMKEQTDPVKPTPLEDTTLATLGLTSQPSNAANEVWFYMMSYEEAAELPNQTAEPSEDNYALWERAEPISIALAAARIKTELLRKRIANFRRADRRRGGAGDGTPQPEPADQVDAFCVMLARMLRFEPSERASIDSWSQDPALAFATDTTQNPQGGAGPASLSTSQRP